MPTSTHPPKWKYPRVGADGRYCTGFQFSPRRGGRPCPPAGIARFYGNPMRNRNILEGRCGHRPLQKTSQDFTILEGGQGRPPLQPVLENRVQVEKPPRCPFHAVGVDAYIDPPSKTETPPRGADGRYCTGFRFRPCKMPRKTQYFPFHAVGVDAHIDPPSKMEIPPRGGGWTLLYRVSIFTP